MSSQLPPWHMWGTSDLVTVHYAAGVAPTAQATQQTTRIEYARPENWKFFFAAKIISFESAALSGDFDVAFDVNFGLGRSTITIPNFELFQFIAYPSGGGPSSFKWSTEVIAPLRSPTDINPSKVTSIVAQQLNVNARVNLRNLSAAVAADVTVEVHTYFAPNVHIRPEWNIHHFPGNETQGH